MNGNNQASYNPGAVQPGQQPTIFKDFFVYQENFLALAAGTTAVGQINIQADSDFELQKLTLVADIAAAAFTDSTRPIPLCDIQITDSGSGRNLLESAVPVSALFGTGELPFILPTPKVFAGKSTITVTVSNFDAAVAYNLRLSFIGRKLFYGRV